MSDLASPDEPINVGARLSEVAARDPQGLAIAEPQRRDAHDQRHYRKVTFRQLDEDSSVIAAGLWNTGVQPGMRVVLMVRPSIDFISLVFAFLKAGVVMVLIDPGMGRRNLVRCLQETDPQGFVAVPEAQAVRCLLRWKFPRARFNVTVGRRWFWRGPTLANLRTGSIANFRPLATRGNDPAAIIFTTGSTGPPKGVLYRHQNFSYQIDQIQGAYDIQPGEIDLPCFPLFGMFNCVMGVSTVIPVMDPTRPANVDPREIVEPIFDFNITQAFGSPALWNVVGLYCQRHQVRMDSLRRVLSAGAPVPPHVLRRLKAAIHPDGDVHTPYGATESLPVATISGTEVLTETEAKSNQGAGTCVGHRFSEIEWKIIRISDDPISSIDEVDEVPQGEIGEIIVQGPVVTSEYVTQVAANALHKVPDGDSFWHRIGDVGYVDDQDRFWFCGRKAHRVVTAEQTMFTIPCEAIFNQHERVFRSALVGVGKRGKQIPVIIVEAWPDKRPLDDEQRKRWRDELLILGKACEHTACIEHVLIHRSMPVDIRHNSKIFREQLARWAAKFVPAE